jgi:hypothetical protein
VLLTRLKSLLPVETASSPLELTLVATASRKETTCAVANLLLPNPSQLLDAQRELAPALTEEEEKTAGPETESLSPALLDTRLN